MIVIKRILVITAALIFVISLVSCGIPNKKVIPQNQPPKVEDTQQKKTSNENQNPSNPDNINSQNAGNPDDIYSYTYKNEESSNTEIGQIPETLSNDKIASWMPGTNKEHKVPVLSPKYKNLLDKYDGYFVGDTTSNVIYLTFDEGYENGYTGQILDILKANNVKAAFFVTKPYIKSNPELVKRMVEEGHIVGNHTETHPSMPDVSNEKVIKELTNTADYFKEVTGYDIPKFLRPPMGEWSERTLYITKAMGYKTILWSMAHMDWDPKNQPGKEKSFKFVDTYYHNGAILLLHAVSKSNTEALDDIVKNLKEKGYRFASLAELK